jgi:glucosyl-dolichyl phosphate glucuronosyltransferase
MQVSIIIPTYNRINELSDALNSVLTQTAFPLEVIIVDDSDDDRISDLCQKKEIQFLNFHIKLKYIRNYRQRSNAIARNTGIDNTNGDIVLFLDDDVILDKNFLLNILEVYEKYPSAVGVQGYITNVTKYPSWRNEFNRLFSIGFYEKDKCRVLKSTHNTYPIPLTTIINCQWMSGANQSFKKNILTEFRFDENLKSYAFKEDLDLSYRVFKKYPQGLFITPHSKLIHLISQNSRLNSDIMLNIQYVNSFYIFFKDFNGSVSEKIIFYWSWIGYLLIPLPVLLFFSLITFNKPNMIKIKSHYISFLFVLLHLDEIRQGNLTYKM